MFDLSGFNIFNYFCNREIDEEPSMSDGESDEDEDIGSSRVLNFSGAL